MAQWHQTWEEPIRRTNDSLGFLCQKILSFLLFWLLNNRINNLLSGEEVPHAASVELISKSVEQGIEDGVCLCNDWKQLQAETCLKALGFKDNSGLLQLGFGYNNIHVDHNIVEMMEIIIFVLSHKLLDSIITKLVLTILSFGDTTFTFSKQA